MPPESVAFAQPHETTRAGYNKTHKNLTNGHKQKHFWFLQQHVKGLAAKANIWTQKNLVDGSASI